MRWGVGRRDPVGGEQTVSTVGEEEGALISWEDGKADVQRGCPAEHLKQ